MIDLHNFMSSDNYKIVGYFTKSHVDKNEFLEAVIQEWDDLDPSELDVSDVKQEYWKVMTEEEVEKEGIDSDEKKLEYYFLSEESDPRSFPVTAIFLDESYKVL